MTIKRAIAPMLALLALLCSSLVCPSMVSAQSTVVILGLTSNIDDELFADNYTVAVRDASRRVDGFRVRNQSIGLDQLMVLHDCQGPDRQCIQAISADIGVDVIIFGAVDRSSSTDDFRYRVELGIYRSGEIANTSTYDVERGDLSIQGLMPVATAHVDRLLGREGGRLHLNTNAPHAAVLIDGERMGTTGPTGVATIDTLPPGSHDVQVRSDSFRVGHQTFEVHAGRDTVLSLELEALTEEPGPEPEPDLQPVPDVSVQPDPVDPPPPVVSDSGTPSWPGWALVTLGALSLGGMGITWAVLSGIGTTNDGSVSGSPTEFEEARIAWDGAAPQQMDPAAAPITDFDLCSHDPDLYTFAGDADRHREVVRARCGEAATLETLQYVFGIAGGVFLVSGIIYLLATGGSDDGGASVAIAPMLSPELAGLSASGTF